MSSQNGDSLSSGPLFEGHPWVWVIIPLSIVLAVGALACSCHTYRMRRRKKRILLDPRGRQALERDLEEALAGREPTRRAGAGAAGRTPGQRWARPTTRWAWATNLTSARPEEGLNELGEAPPPYDGKKVPDGPKDDETRQGIELDEVEAGGSRRPGQGRETDQPGLVEPPAYSPPSRRSSITEPPPAVLRPDSTTNHRHG
ncbi:hypothetical protein NKR23_g7769 [Pleurostoma richardsiae]|uniref:Uncharacterized protein n=1 Tax=Pleurostoma richardsiae TaxID=41990 RepID=A0AA38RHG5_9PEZI|nr:hypothetical protein NKR23_g7769 [Pleurostoma richardsiae]